MPPWWFAGDIVAEARARWAVYSDDWSQGRRYGHRILAPATYIFCASALPALAFGQQLATETGGSFNLVHVLASTAICGVIQAVLGGQPLLIVGVAEPIVIIFSFLYLFAAGQPGLGPSLYLPWTSWVSVWTAAFVLLLALVGSCRAIRSFTRFSGEVFGALIAVLFMQVAIKGIIDEFKPSHAESPRAAGPADEEDQLKLLVNGLCQLILALGLLLSSLAVVKARRWRFLKGWLRGLLADYGVPLMVLAWSGLSFAVQGVPGVPRRVQTTNTWEVVNSWTVTSIMGQVPGSFIAAAALPALIITILFYFDHNVSSQLAQQPEFNLTKPPAYAYDFMLLAFITLICGLLGLPPVNGVLPQAPMHTRSLAKVKPKHSSREASSPKHLTPPATKPGQLLPLPPAAADPAAALAEALAAISSSARSSGGAAAGGLAPSTSQAALLGPGPEASGQQDGIGQSRAVAAEQAWGVAALGRDADGPAACARAVQGTTAGGGAASGRAAAGGGVGAENGSHQVLAEEVVPLQVAEQRFSGLLQSLLVALCLGLTPAIQAIPTGVLWGYFAYMALDSLPGSQLWERVLLLATDAKKRGAVLQQQHAAYLQLVPFKVVAGFTLIQLVYLAGMWALITFAGVAGVAFPLPIMALVPVRQYLLPRLFHPGHLRELDAAEYEEAPPLDQQGANQVLVDGAVGPDGDAVSEAEHLEEEFHGVQPVHHLTPEQLQQRAHLAADGYTGGQGGLLPSQRVHTQLHQRHRLQMERASAHGDVEGATTWRSSGLVRRRSHEI